MKNNHPIDQEVKQVMLSLSDHIVKTSLAELARPSITKNTEMLLVWQYFSAASIRKSLKQANIIR